MRVAIGVDGGRLVLAGGKAEKDLIRIRKFAEQPLGDRTVRDGIVGDSEQLVPQLKEFVKANVGRGDSAVLVLDCPGILFRELTVPSGREKETRKIIQNEMSYSQGNGEEYILDYLTISENREEKTSRIMVYAMPRTVLEDWMQAAEAADLKLDAVTVAADSMCRLSWFLCGRQNTEVLVKIDSGGLDIRLEEEGICTLSRHMRLNVSTFFDSGTPEIAAEEIADYLNRVYQFQRTRKQSSGIDVVRLCGTFSQLDPLCGLVSDSTGVECRRLDWSGVRAEGQFDPERQLNVLGALLG